MDDKLAILRAAMEPKPIALGDRPWSRESLTRASFQNSKETKRIVEALPGAAFQSRLDSLGLSLDVFSDAVRELLASIDDFRDESRRPGFYSRVRELEFEAAQLRVRRNLFSASAASMALVDHTRVVQDALALPGYRERVNATFRDVVAHRFIQEIRNCVVHARLLPADWRTTVVFGQGESTHFYIRRDILLEWGGWSAPVQAFIEKLDYGADIEHLFRGYSGLVNSFHDWYRKEIEFLGGDELEEYRSYIHVLKGIGWRSSYGILLQIARSARIDPFERLSEYLLPDELELVFALSDWKAQVDKIIEILDVYDACEDWLRQAAYQAFGVASDQNGAL